ncbi:MAG: T9SS type A sorting domain-containing protein [Flavobacteriales bacterium]
MRLITLLAALGGSSLLATATNPVSGPVPREVTFITDAKRLPDVTRQAQLRALPAWQQFKQQHGAWAVEFNEATGLPHRAYGRPIATTGNSPEERALEFLSTELGGYALPVNELVLTGVRPTEKLTYVHFSQKHQGLPVIFSHVMVKLDLQGNVISFGLEMERGIDLSTTPAIGNGAVEAAAIGGLSNVQSVSVEQGLSLLGVPDGFSVEHKLVFTAHVITTEPDGAPGKYDCLVDANSGELLYRQDRVMHCGLHHNDKDHDAARCAPMESSSDVTVSATVYEVQPYIAPTVQPVRNLQFTVNGNTFTTDPSGSAATGITGPVSATFRLEGEWSSVRTNNVVPEFTTTLQDGPNAISFDSDANIKELSAYFHVNIVHDHCVAVLPGFTGMDFSLPTNVDVAGNCNAFYDGSSINFYAEGNDCHSWAKLGEVVYHEYGHGINDNYYQDNGSFFNNGGMNEGYADIWALTITWDPILAEGNSLTLPNDYIRRYDQAPKVYPVDISGEVHNDGEIIAGAWWDLYENLNDQALLLTLWADAFGGLQATAPSGQEGTAFRDVLLDVLEADDTDNDILNGTPNGTAIIEAFAEHGITLLSNVELDHTPVLTSTADDDITITAELTILSADQQYLGDVVLNYKLNGAAAWTEVLMTNTGGNNYEAQIPGQPIGTVIAYFLAAEDVFGFLSGVQPIGAAQADPNLPYYIMVGFDLKKTEDADNTSELGDWALGLPTDNNTTGTWTIDDPNPSLSTVDNSEIQPDDQHTPGGDFCFLTGNAAVGEGPGINDVDEGRTTLISDPMDLTEYENPTFTYWRWYTNNPPGGANPGADWWYAEITNNGTNWVFVENSQTSERNWRRKAFRVQDYVTPNATVQLRFIASDSTHTGQNLDGGSLIEGLVDDIQLWDNSDADGISELHGATIASLYPDPANDAITVRLELNGARNVSGEIIDPAGRIVTTHAFGDHRAMETMDVSRLASGTYLLRVRWDGGKTEQRFTVVH